MQLHPLLLLLSSPTLLQASLSDVELCLNALQHVTANYLSFQVCLSTLQHVTANYLSLKLTA